MSQPPVENPSPGLPLQGAFYWPDLMAKPDSKLIQQTLEIWQPSYEEALTLEDARAMVANVAAFFDLLRDWDVLQAQTEGKEGNDVG